MARVWVLIAKVVEWLCSPINFRERTPATTTARTRRLPLLKVHILKGSFVTAGSGEEDDGRAAAAMDADVWSKLPEELVWEVVVRMVPAAKHFQLHSVSR